MTFPGRLLVAWLACGVASVPCGSEPRSAERNDEAREWVDLVEAFTADPAPPDTQSIVFGTPAAYPLMGTGWARALEREKGATFSWAVGLRSELRLYAGDPEGRVLAADVRPFLAERGPGQRIELRVNGRSLGSRELSPERQELHWDAPRDVWRTGANQLEAFYAHARAPKAPGADGGDTRPLSVAWFGLRVEGPATPQARIVSAQGAKGLLLPFSRPVVFSVDAGKILELRWNDAETPWPPGSVKVRAQTCGEANRCSLAVDVIVRRGVQRVRLPGGAGPRRVSLQAVWLGDKAPSAEGLVLSGPKLGPVSLARETPAPDSVASRPVQHDTVPNVLVYLVDTLRADRLGLYGYDRPTSPRLDALARQSIVFDRAYANAPWTLPAVASVFTGLYPWTHGADGLGKRIGGPGMALGPGIVTLAESLGGAGYVSAAFFTNGIIGAKTGLGSGFSVYQRIPEDPASEAIHARAGALNRTALSWLDQRHSRRPFFLYLHASDPHAPYRPPSAQRQRFAPRVPAGDIGSTQAIERLVNAPEAGDERFAAPMSDLYDGEVAYTDEAFGELLDALEQRGLLQDTLLVFLADHGEALYEHHVWGHEWWLYEEVIRIPLLVRLPGMHPAGWRSAEVVQQVDLLPTILEFVGLPIPDGVQGRSLAPILAGGTVSPRPAYAGESVDGRISWAEVDGTRKTIVHQHYAVADAGRDGIDIFDLAADPRELTDGAAATPVAAGARRLRVLTEIARHPRRAAVAAAPADLDVLRSLGYVR